MNVVWQKKKQVGGTKSSLSNYLSVLLVWCRSNKPADFGVTRSPYQHHHGMSQNIRSMWPDYHYYGIFHNSIWGKHKKKWPAEFGVTKKSSLSCICKNSMVCQTLEQVTHLGWRDQITTIAIFSRPKRRKQGQVTSQVWCGQIITIKLSVTKVEARDEQKIVQPDHHCHTICHDSVVRQTKEQGTNLVWCDQIITILSSAIPVLCDHINIIMICMTTVLHYKQLRWPTQGDVTRLSLLYMLSFTTVFGANIRTSDQLSLAWPKIITSLYL